MFGEWLIGGCVLSVHDTVSASQVQAERRLADVVLETNGDVLAVLAESGNEWVRLAVAGNAYTPEFVKWGDGVSTRGLSGDESQWVSAAILIHHPSPPPDVVAAIEAAATARPRRSVQSR